jgi:hypothetical protein
MPLFGLERFFHEGTSRIALARELAIQLILEVMVVEPHSRHLSLCQSSKPEQQSVYKAILTLIESRIPPEFLWIAD